MSSYDSWKTRSDRDEYPDNFDPSWEEDVDLPGEVYDEEELTTYISASPRSLIGS